MSFCLLDEPWIPVRRRDGSREWIAPSQVTEDLARNPIIGLASSRPDFDGALIQFLIGLLQTTRTPRNPRDWRHGFDEPPSPVKLAESFSGVREAFELLGDGPRFFQDLTLSDDEGSVEPIGRLLIDEPGSATLRQGKDHFVKRGRLEALCPACAGTALLTLQLNAPSGGQGHRTGLRGGGPLTTILFQPDSLWKSLWLNVLEIGKNRPIPGGRSGSDWAEIFPWLAPTRTSERGTGVETTPEDAHPLQVYWSMPRRLRLIPDAASHAEPCGLCRQESEVLVRRYRTKNLGINYTGPWLHPLTPHTLDAAGTPMPRHGSRAGLAYRDWLGLVWADADKKRTRVPALVIQEHLRDATRSKRSELLLWAFGYDMDNMKARSWNDGKMPFYAAEDSDRAGEYEAFGTDLIRGALAVRKALVAAVLAAGIDVRDASARFWQESERGFFSALATLSSRHDDALEERLRRYRYRQACTLARDIFSDAVHDEMLAANKAQDIAEAWNRLNRTLAGRHVRSAFHVPLESKSAKGNQNHV